MIEKPSNPYVFVVGCPRSGTTLLQRMLDAHSQLAVANDTHFIPWVLYEMGRDDNPPLTPEIVRRVRTYKRFHRLGLDDAAVARAAEGASDYAGFVAGLYDELARAHAKALGGEKTPGYVRHLPMLHRLFPQARFVHIIRDGRDVALSAFGWARDEKGPGRIPLWKDEPAAAAALWWRRNVQMGREDGDALGPDLYRQIRYEDLVAQPEQSLRDLASFLGLPYEQRMAEFHVGKTRDGSQRSAKSAWLGPTRGLRDWRTQMSARDAELFEAIAGDLLSALGYERSTESASPQIAAVARRCRAWWDRRTWLRISGSRDASELSGS